MHVADESVMSLVAWARALPSLIEALAARGHLKGPGVQELLEHARAAREVAETVRQWWK